MHHIAKILRTLTATAIAVAALIGGATPSNAQMMTDLRRDGETYHARACAEPTRPGFARCHARVVTDRDGHPLGQLAQTDVAPRGYDPASLQAAYAVDPNAGSPTTNVAVVDAYGYPNAEADLAVYRSTYGLPPCTTANGCFRKYNQRGSQTGFPGLSNGWATETALDLDMVSAMCPKCRIVLVEADTSSTADLAASVNTAASLGAHAISNSYGAGESGSQPYESAYNHVGVAITVSTGDRGYGVEFPASSPHVIATGGTTLKRYAGAPRGWTETAWRYGGSGCSAIYSKPSWQTDKSCTHRMEADVSAVSDPATGVASYGPVYKGGSAWHVLGGTSVAAPIIAGIYGANGAGVAASDLYAHPAELFDIVGGANGTCAVSYFCTAGAGYDGPTGLGTPKGAAAF